MLSIGVAERNEVDVRNFTAEQNRQQTRAEEIANSISHGMGLIAALIGTPILIVDAVHNENILFVVGSIVFCATVIILYLVSTVYHALPLDKAKRVFRVTEHSAIFLIIAGTYTPFTLGVLHGAWDWALLGVVWGIALVLVSLKAIYLATRPILFTSLYLLMGWVAVIAVKPFFASLPTKRSLLLIAMYLIITDLVGLFGAGEYHML